MITELRLTKDETDSAEEGVYEVQAPLDRALKNRSKFANHEIESPVAGRAQTGTLCSDA